MSAGMHGGLLERTCRMSRQVKQTDKQVNIVVTVSLYLIVTDPLHVDKTRRLHPRITTV